MSDTFNPSTAGQTDHFVAHVLPGGDQHLIGDKRAFKRLKKRGVRVAIPHNTDLIICVQAVGQFLTYGPVGGDNTIYDLIRWAYDNVPAFGVAIELRDGINMPVLVLPNKKAAKAALAWLNAKGAGA